MARRFMRVYLLAEVGRADSRALAQLRTLTTGAATRQATAAPRPTNHGYPPAGRLTALRPLPVLRPGHWTLEAHVIRAGRYERWELHLAGTPAGPRVTAFTTTRSTP